MAEDDFAYNLERAEEERYAADSAATVEARHAHLRLAALYERNARMLRQLEGADD